MEQNRGYFFSVFQSITIQTVKTYQLNAIKSPQKVIKLHGLVSK
jgi:hypothetical protein